MDSKFNSWPNNDPTDSFTSVQIAASMKVPPSLFIHPVLISLSVPFLILWHRDMSVGRRSSLRMLECPLFKVQWRIEKFIQLSGVWRAAGGGILGRTKGEMFCMYHCSLVACPHFPPLPRLSVYCIHGDLRDIAPKTRLVTIRRNILSLNVKIFVKVVRIVRSQALFQLILRTKERQIVNCHSTHSVEQRWSHSCLWN